MRLTGDAARKYLQENPNARFTDNTTGQVYGGQSNTPQPAQQPGVLTNVFNGISRPFRQAAGVTEEFGLTLNDLVKALRGEAVDPDARAKQNYKYALLNEEESQALANDPLKIGLKSGAGVASYGIGGGGIGGSVNATSTLGKIGQAAGYGALGGGLGAFSASKDGDELESTLKGIGLGGAIGGGLQAAGEGIKALKAAGLDKKLNKYSDDLKVTALKKRVGSTPTMKQGKNNLVRDVIDTADGKVVIKNADDLNAFGQKLIDDNATLANSAAQQLDQAGVTVDFAPIREDLVKQLNAVKQPELKRPIEKVISSIDQATGGTNVVSPSEFLQLRREWGKLGNWNSLMDPKATAVAGVWEDVYLNANDLLDDLFTKNGMSNFKEVNKAIKTGIEAQNWAERALANKSGGQVWTDMAQDATMFGTALGGGPGSLLGFLGSKGLQKNGEAIAAKGLSGLADIVGGVSNIGGQGGGFMQQLSQIGQRALPGAAGQAVGGIQPQQIESTSPETVLQQPQQNSEVEALKMSLVNAIASGEISTTEANAIMSMLGIDDGTSDGASTEGQRDYQLAAESLKDAYNLIDDGAGKLPTLGGNIAGFFGSTTGSSEYRASLDTALAFLRKALIGSGQSEAELKNLNLPKPTDEPAIAKQKIEALIPLLYGRAGVQNY